MKSLDNFYTDALTQLGSSKEITISLKGPLLLGDVDTILSRSESAKGVLTVVITSLVYKIMHPEQDIRYHQAKMDGGYSGRSFDSTNITPFLKSKNFPSMAESGWLTRSLEQNRPYNLDYTGSIRPTVLKTSFLSAISNIEENSKKDNTTLLLYIMQYLILQRNKFNIQLAKPNNLSISILVNILKQHFFSTYSSDGASRLPALAFYAIYECLTSELKRFENKKLLDIENHTSADTRSGRIGDIDIIDENERIFESVEIKHGIPISLQLVKDAYSKFSTTSVKRYYILSTADILELEHNEINKEIENIKRIHGCQLIVNGIVKSLNYYLRLMDDTLDFVENYVKLLESDKTIKFEHKLMWNTLINKM